MHKNRQREIPVGGLAGKTAVIGILERGGEIRATTVQNTRTHNLLPEIMKNIQPGSTIYTDAANSYNRLSRVPGYFNHKTVDHEVCFVDGDCHTNGLENFWSLLKRTIRGTYVSVEPFHLDQYLHEQTFRYNNRKVTDGDRFALLTSSIAGKRLTYANLTGKVTAAA